MAHALPVTKLAGLLLKTLAKPVAKRIKHECSRRPFPRRVLIGIGQASHQFTSRLTIWSAGYKVRSVNPLDEEKALSTGSEFISESFLLIVSGAIVVFEYNRSKESQQKKDEQHRAQAKAERMALQAKLHALDVRVKALEVVVKQNSESILNIGGARYVAPEDTVPIDDDNDNDDNTNHEESVGKPKEEQSVLQSEKFKNIFPSLRPAASPTPATTASTTEQPAPQQQQPTELTTTNTSDTSSSPPVPERVTKPWWQFW